ncbi:metal-dependent hydrolase [Chloroflexota bacterium]
MLLFGHTGITLGLAYGLDRVLSNKVTSSKIGAVAEKSSGFSRLASITGKIDYRLVLLGSMLPDIDKLIGIYLFGDTFDNGRIICHTLVFFLIILSIGLYRFRRYAKVGFLALAFGVATHLIFDEMWNAPHTLFWPLDGISFPDEDVSDFVGLIWESMTTRPKSYITEIIGLIFLIPIGIRLLAYRHVIQFFKKGTLP